MSISQHPMLNAAINIVRSASSIIIEASLKKHTIVVEKKAEKEIVTNLDYLIDNLIIKSLKKSFPNHKFLSEEGGITGNLSSDYLWILDPIDGTNNFSHLFPHYCIALALQYKGETEIGIVYQTSCDYLFSAIKGEGAQMNNRRIRVSDIKSFDDSLICLGNNPVSKESYITKQYQNMVANIGSIRFTGAYALDLSYVASGIFDGLIVMSSPKIWDVTAGVLIVRESGGLVLDIETSNNYISGPLIAGNPKMVEKIISIYQNSKHIE